MGRQSKESIESAFFELESPPTKDFLNAIIDKYRFTDKYKAKPVTLSGFIQSFIDKASHRVNRKQIVLFPSKCKGDISQPLDI